MSKQTDKQANKQSPTHNNNNIPTSTTAMMRTTAVAIRQYNTMHRQSLSTQTTPRRLYHRYYNSTSLGLQNRFVLPHLDAIQTLPEVAAGMEHGSVDALERALQVFRGLPDYHTAVLALLADQQQKRGMYTAALSSVESLLQQQKQQNDDGSDKDAQLLSLSLLSIAKAKTLWYNGDFAESVRVTDELLQQQQQDEDNAGVEMAIARCVALNANGLALLPLDATAAVERFQSAVEDTQRLLSVTPLLQMAILNNLGVATTIVTGWNDGTVGGEGDHDHSNDNNHALSIWNDALQVSNPEQSYGPPTAWLRANVRLNMAHVLLQKNRKDDNDTTDDQDSLQLASEYSKEALSLIESLSSNTNNNDDHDTTTMTIANSSGVVDSGTNKMALHRALCVVAMCYHKAGSAVTSEGLFQTITEDNASPLQNPLHMLTIREALAEYAGLCRNWEKRSGDADRLLERREELMRNVESELWKEQPALLSGTWFLTIEDAM